MRAASTRDNSNRFENRRTRYRSVQLHVLLLQPEDRPCVEEASTLRVVTTMPASSMQLDRALEQHEE
jgi:hypothetical protein